MPRNSYNFVFCQFIFIRQPCHEKKYKHKAYSSPWPHESYQLAFYCKHIDNDGAYCEKYGNYKGNPGLAEQFSGLYDRIGEEIDESTFDYLRHEGTIARNFLQLKVYFLVNVTLPNLCLYFSVYSYS